jgi:hypothetical protein
MVMSDIPTKKSDSVREHIAEMAQACLDHVRVVTWGEAISAYVMEDGNGIELAINIRVKAIRRVEKRNESSTK